MNLVNTNYWDVLGITPGVDDAAIKSAFRKQARRWHPDLNSNDPIAEERFKQIKEAYEILSDHNRRSEWEESYSNKPNDEFNSGFPSFRSYFEILTNFSQTIPKYANQKDHEYFESDANTFDLFDSSSLPTSSSLDQFKSSEMFIYLTPQQALQGSLLEIDLPNGTTVEVETPPLAGHGWRIVLPGMATNGNDQFLQLQIETESGLRIDGLTVFYELELFPPDAALGCTVVIPTLSGSVRLQVPACSSSGHLLRLQHQGLIQGEFQGDQFVEIKIILPNEISEVEEDLYYSLQEFNLYDQGNINPT
uniref:Heat shock protein DnaJ-like protein n=1 Tax=Paulinella chromatophora TaxID=39717 RepID=B1X3U1_PAUCH|nr:Heat shock protein DnaJ-like protein [Paulinella chromatophora]ACB42610.1 Heat shock protein DnaJ-like protein [Paulinella chromatophora]